MKNSMNFLEEVLKSIKDLFRLSQVLEETDFMQKGQELAEKFTNSKIAFIHFVHEDEENIELVNWSKNTLQHYCKAAYMSHYPVREAGIWADALRKREPIIINDYPNYAHKKGMPEGHAHLERFISVPIISKGKVVMLAGVGNKESDYTSLDVAIVQLISNEVWHYVDVQKYSKKLKDTQKEFKTFFDSSNDGIIVYPFVKEGMPKITKVNQTLCDRLGYTKEEMLKLTLVDINTPEMVKYYEKKGLRFELLEKKSLVFESVQVTKDGQKIPVEINSRLFSLNDKKFVISSTRDITKRKYIQTQLKKTMKAYKEAQKIARLGYYHYNVKANEWYCSSVLEDIFGIDISFKKDFKNWLSIIHPDYRLELELYLQNQIKNKNSFNKEYQIVNQKDGLTYWVHGRGEFKLDAEGNVAEMFGTIQDITESKNLKNELEEKENMMILQSRHAAMGEIISMIAHQWRQPLSDIVMDANNILLDIELDDLQKDVLNDQVNSIIQQSGHLSQTIDDFRDFFKPNKIPQKGFLKDMFDGLFKIIHKSLESKNVKLNINTIVNSQVKTLFSELTHVLLNLINNSKEAIIVNKKQDIGYINIDIDEVDDYLLFSISDNGGGIPEEIIHKVFDPYFSTKKKLSGTGLGLYMSKIIVEEHLKGSITVKNTSEGALFEIIIPKYLEESIQHKQEGVL